MSTSAGVPRCGAASPDDPGDGGPAEHAARRARLRASLQAEPRRQRLRAPRRGPCQFVATIYTTSSSPCAQFTALAAVGSSHPDLGSAGGDLADKRFSSCSEVHDGRSRNDCQSSAPRDFFCRTTGTSCLSEMQYSDVQS